MKKIIGQCEIYLSDCESILPEIGGIDMVVTSPPYDGLRTYGGMSGFDYIAVARMLYQSVNDGGVVMWNVADQVVNGSETGTSFRQAIAFMDAGFRLHDTMIYAKNMSRFPDPVRYDNAFEFMFIFSKGNPNTFTPLRDKENISFGRFSQGTERQADGSMKPIKNRKPIKKFGKRLNWWVINHEQSCTEHPATMPYAMARDQILSWSAPGDTVIDPFMGSGTTGVACIKTGRRFVGVENNPEYFDISYRRLEEAMAQPDMFV